MENMATLPLSLYSGNSDGGGYMNHCSHGRGDDGRLQQCSNRDVARCGAIGAVDSGSATSPIAEDCTVGSIAARGKLDGGGWCVGEEINNSGAKSRKVGADMSLPSSSFGEYRAHSVWPLNPRM
jgi:hypothetical protein